MDIATVPPLMDTQVDFSVDEKYREGKYAVNAIFDTEDYQERKIEKGSREFIEGILIEVKASPSMDLGIASERFLSKAAHVVFFIKEDGATSSTIRNRFGLENGGNEKGFHYMKGIVYDSNIRPLESVVVSPDAQMVEYIFENKPEKLDVAVFDNEGKVIVSAVAFLDSLYADPASSVPGGETESNHETFYPDVNIYRDQDSAEPAKPETLYLWIRSTEMALPNKEEENIVDANVMQGENPGFVLELHKAKRYLSKLDNISIFIGEENEKPIAIEKESFSLREEQSMDFVHDIGTVPHTTEFLSVPLPKEVQAYLSENEEYFLIITGSDNGGLFSFSNTLYGNSKDKPFNAKKRVV